MTEYKGEDRPMDDVSAGGNTTFDQVVRRLIDKEEQVEALRQENQALRTEREDLLAANTVLEQDARVAQDATVLSTRVVQRIKDVLDYIDTMTWERMGYSEAAMQDVHDTRASFLKAFRTLIEATDIWPDGQGLSFGGNMQGIQFGMIAWEQRLTDDSHEFEHHPIEWSFHS